MLHHFGVSVEDRHAHRRRIHAQARQAEDLAGLPDDLHLLAGIAVVLEGVDVRHAVEGDLACAPPAVAIGPWPLSSAAIDCRASSSTASRPAPDTDW